MGDGSTTKSCRVPYLVYEQLRYSLSETHTWAISLEKKSHTFLFLHSGCRCSGFPWRKVRILRIRMLIYRSWAAGYKFPMCTFSIHITAALGGISDFPGCTPESFSFYILKWAVRDLTHIHTVKMDSNGCCTEPYNILEVVWTRRTELYEFSQPKNMVTF